MNLTEKKQIISQIVLLLERLIETQPPESTPKPQSTDTQPLEMLTVKECAALVNGLSEHTLSQVVAQDKGACVRAGNGERGEIPWRRASLDDY